METNSCQNLHFEQPGFAYSTCEPFTKHRERIQTFREKGNLKHLYRNELDKACLVNDAIYFDSKDLAKRTILDKSLKDRTYEISRNRRYDGYQRALASMVHKYFDKKTGSGTSANEQLDKELDKPIIKKFKRRKFFARFKDNIWEADLVEMRSKKKVINIYYVP